MSTKYSGTVYGGFYRMAEKRDPENKSHSISKLTNNILSRRLVAFLKGVDPDVIVCTHLFAAQLMTYISRRIKLKYKTIGVITDFTIHPFWEDTELDYYITASELLTNQAVKRGIPEKKILPFGIPIHPKFAKKVEKHEARRELGIPDKTTVFVMSGSMGYGKMAKFIMELDSSTMDFQIISVCGFNKRLKKNIDKLELEHKIFNYGFADNVDVLMDAADCIVTKPGGLTTSESLAKGLPIFIVNPIPGQEDRNVEFLLNNGAAMRISSTFRADDAIYQLLTIPKRAEIQQASVQMLGKPNSARDLGDFILNLVKG